MCGKGFYVRSFARDFALDLETYGHISSLKRSKVGKFTKKTSILLDDLLKIGQRHKEINCISPSISMLDDILAYEIEEQLDIDNLSFGRSIKIDEKKIINSSSINLDKRNIFLFKFIDEGFIIFLSSILIDLPKDKFSISNFSSIS